MPCYNMTMYNTTWHVTHTMYNVIYECFFDRIWVLDPLDLDLDKIEDKKAGKDDLNLELNLERDCNTLLS